MHRRTNHRELEFVELRVTRDTVLEALGPYATHPEFEDFPDDYSAGHSGASNHGDKGRGGGERFGRRVTKTCAWISGEWVPMCSA